jgi:hypothetical protein
MRQRLLEVLESDENDVSDDAGDALGRFWPRAKTLPRAEQAVVVDLAAWAARHRSPKR